jgi:hypothetical protein
LLRNPDLDRPGRAQAQGEVAMRLILAGTGPASILLSSTRFGPFAAFACSTLPLGIGHFSGRYDRTGGQAEE